MEGETKDQETEFCSNCKRDIPAANFMMHEPHCRRHVELCKLCKEPVPKSQMEEHIEENHVEVPCEKCQRKVAKDLMDDHLADECPNRSVHCDFCDLDIKVNEYNSHAYVCGSRTDICEVCQMRVMLRDMENHGKDRCGVLHSTGLINPSPPPQRPPVLDLPRDSLPYAEVELDSVRDMDAPQWPDRPNPFDDVPYAALDNGDVAYPEQEVDPSGPSQMPGHAYNSRPANMTMQIDVAWLNSMRAVYGEDADLDAIVAQNMMMENMRQVTAHDDRPLPPDYSSLQSQRPGVNTQMIRDDAALANALQYDFSQQDIFTAHDTSMAQQLQSEIDTEDTHPYQNIPPENTTDDEALAIRLQEEENRRIEELSARQYDLKQEEVASRRQAEMEDNSSNEHPVTDDFLARQLLLEDQPSSSPPHLREDPRDNNLAPSVELHHGESDSRNQFGVGHAPAEPPTCEPRQEEVEQIDDIPCDLCSEAIPFHRYNDHLQMVHGNHPSVNEFGSRRVHHHQPYYNHFPVHQTHPPHDEHLSREQEYPLEGRQSLRQHSAYVLDESDVISCKFCGQSVSRDNIGNHEAVCLQNQRSLSSSFQPERVVSPSQPARDDSPVAGNEDMVPCEFCEELHPLAAIQKHQAQCRHHPVHRRYQFGEDHGSLDDSLGNEPLPAPDDATEPAGESTGVFAVLPCDICNEMFSMEELHTHEALCKLKQQALNAYQFPPVVTSNQHFSTKPPVMYSSARYHQPQASPCDEEFLTSRDASTVLPVSTHSPKPAKHKRKIHLAPNFPNARTQSAFGGHDSSRDVQSFSPISPSQDKPGTAAGTQDKGTRELLVTGYDTSSGSEMGSGQDSSELVVMSSQVENCHITSGSSESGYPDSPLPDMPASSSAHRRQKTKLLATVPLIPRGSSSGKALELGVGQSGRMMIDITKSSRLHVEDKYGVTSTILGTGPSGRLVVDTTKSSPFRAEDKYSSASKTSSKQYGALRSIDVKPVENSSHFGSRVSPQVKVPVGTVSGRHVPGMQNGLSGQGKTLQSRPSYPRQQSSGNARTPTHAGTGARKTPSFDSRSTRKPTQKGSSFGQSYQPKNDTYRSNSKPGSVSTYTRTKQNGY